MSEDTVRVDFNAPASLVEEADAVADLLDTSRTSLLVDGLRKQLEEVASEEAFQRRLRDAFYDGRVSRETVARVFGTEEAVRMELLRDSLERDPSVPDAEHVHVPDAESFYAGEVPTWQPEEAETVEASAATAVDDADSERDDEDSRRN